MEAHDELTEESAEEFGELLRFTLAGYVAGMSLGVVLDQLGLGRSGLGQWAVRTLSGEGESIFEGLFAARKRLLGSAGSLAEAYGWGKLFGMCAPWIIDAVSRLAGVDIYGVPGFYIPFFYAMSDQIGASVSGLLFFRRRSVDTRAALRSYFTHPVMIAGLVVITAVPFGLAVARLGGFSPSTQVLTALETIVANLCWVPPLVGWWRERS
jgi:hypothetical protein